MSVELMPLSETSSELSAFLWHDKSGKVIDGPTSDGYITEFTTLPDMSQVHVETRRVLGRARYKVSTAIGSMLGVSTVGKVTTMSDATKDEIYRCYASLLNQVETQLLG